jgi:hypothetical protein
MIFSKFILLIMISLGLILVSIILIIYIVVKLLKEDLNVNLYSLIIVGITLSFLISLILGLFQELS